MRRLSQHLVLGTLILTGWGLRNTGGYSGERSSSMLPEPVKITVQHHSRNMLERR
jgi:hypothetical protein